jgi:hypothetical protein
MKCKDPSTYRDLPRTASANEMARRFLTLRQALEHPALQTALRGEQKAWRDRQTNRLESSR